MTKLILLLVFFSYSMGAQAEAILLDAPTIRYGNIVQDLGRSAFETIEIKRTAATPAQVTFNFGIERTRTQCVRWDTVRTYRPGHSSVQCHHDAFGNRHCTTVWVPGYYDYDQVCVQQDQITTVEENEIVFDFRRADRLRGYEEEIFAIDFDQRRANSTRMDYEVRAVSTAVDYKFSRSLFGKRLKFQAR